MNPNLGYRVKIIFSPVVFVVLMLLNMVYGCLVSCQVKVYGNSRFLHLICFG